MSSMRFGRTQSYDISCVVSYDYFVNLLCNYLVGSFACRYAVQAIKFHGFFTQT